MASDDEVYNMLAHSVQLTILLIYIKKSCFTLDDYKQDAQTHATGPAL